MRGALEPVARPFVALRDFVRTRTFHVQVLLSFQQPTFQQFANDCLFVRNTSLVIVVSSEMMKCTPGLHNKISA